MVEEYIMLICLIFNVSYFISCFIYWNFVTVSCPVHVTILKDCYQVNECDCFSDNGVGTGRTTEKFNGFFRL